MRIAEMKKEVAVTKAAAKETDSGAVAKMKMQHQTVLYDLQYKLKDLELDLGAEKKMQAVAETELMESKQTVIKL